MSKIQRSIESKSDLRMYVVVVVVVVVVALHKVSKVSYYLSHLGKAGL